MLANFLIGLREGLEAALIVSILLTYLVRTDRHHDVKYIWAGVGTAIALVIAVFAVITAVFDQLDFRTQELVGGTMSIIAAFLIVWMIFWMRRTARGLKAELEGEMAHAVELGPLAIATVAFVTVGREGLETATIVWNSIANSYTASPFIGVVAGIITAVLLGYLIYRGALRVNLQKFFSITGALLIVVAAGVLAYGIYDLQEAAFLPQLTGEVGRGLGDQLFNIEHVIPPSSWYGVLLKGTINFQPNPSVLQVICWATFLIVVFTLYLCKPAPKPAQSRV